MYHTIPSKPTDSTGSTTTGQTREEKKKHTTQKDSQRASSRRSGVSPPLCHFHPQIPPSSVLCGRWIHESLWRRPRSTSPYALPAWTRSPPVTWMECSSRLHPLSPVLPSAPATASCKKHVKSKASERRRVLSSRFDNLATVIRPVLLKSQYYRLRARFEQAARRLPQIRPPGAENSKVPKMMS